MSGYDSARAGGRGGAAGRAVDREPSGNVGRVPSSGSYQNGDAQYMTTCSNIEKELRKLATLSAALKKSADSVGTPRDTEELRQKISSSVAKGKEAIKAIGDMLKLELASAVDNADLSTRERTGRKQQQARYTRDLKDAVQGFSEAAAAAQAAERRHPTPAGGAGGGAGAAGGAGAGGGTKRGAAARQGPDEETLLRMRQIDFDSSLVEEREENIIGIASAISEVNETFRDLAQIVQDQGKDIDTIELNVGDAAQSTEGGVGHLLQAEKHQKSYRRWIIVFLAIIIVGAGSIAAFFALKNKKQ